LSSQATIASQSRLLDPRGPGVTVDHRVLGMIESVLQTGPA
jgi:hypothetical protein